MSKVSTPFGRIPESLLSKVCLAAGIRVKNGTWFFIPEKLEFDKETINESGKTVIKTVKVTIPIRAYNFEVHLLETGSLEEAIKRTDTRYLPEDRGFSSYSMLLRHLKERRKTI